MVETLKFWERRFQSVTVLLGNHEATLLECLEGDKATQELWMKFGGRSTLMSFGVDPPREGETGPSFAARLLEVLTEDTVAWLRALPTSWMSGDYFFCHAGVRPRVPLTQQDPEDLLWIRDTFLNSRRYHGAVVVHGHSICGPEVFMSSNRICIDTGAYESGILSAIGLEGDLRWVLKAEAIGEPPRADSS
jgi:serine/threonine protein phosphatase 1